MRVYKLEIESSEIQNQQDVMMIETVLANAPGIGEVQVDIARHVVTVVTANQDGGVDVRQRLDAAGFPNKKFLVL